MHTIKTIGIPLRFVDYKDKDQIIEFYSFDKGKLAILAKGVNSGKSKRKSNLEILNLLQVTLLRSNRGKMPLLGETHLKSRLDLLKNRAGFNAEAFIAAEVINKMIVEEEKILDLNRLVLEITATKLEGQNDNELARTRLTLSWLSIRILHFQGFLAQLSVTLNTQKAINQDLPIMASDTEPGYIEINPGKSQTDMKISRYLRVQKYMISASLEQSLKLQLPLAEINDILNINLNWIKAVIGKNLKSEYLLSLAK